MAASMLANAGVLTITEPASGTVSNPTLIGNNASIKFNITGGVNRVDLVATLRKVSDNTVVGTFNEQATPDADGKASGQIALALVEGVTEEVPYKVTVTARDINIATTYNTITLYILPDLTKPKILQFNPNQTSFVKGVVPITVRVSEANLKDWRVQINNQDIPNNTGTTVNSNGEFVVQWITSGLLTDGPKTINIRVRDEADNETSLAVDVTVDRNPPTVAFLVPRSGSTISPGTTISVVMDITDFNQAALDTSGVDVVVRKMDGTFIARVSRISYNGTGSNTKRWVGRIRWRQGQLPSQFKITASVVDRAGNAASPQTVTVRLGR